MRGGCPGSPHPMDGKQTASESSFNTSLDARFRRIASGLRLCRDPGSLQLDRRLGLARRGLQQEFRIECIAGGLGRAAIAGNTSRPRKLLSGRTQCLYALPSGWHSVVESRPQEGESERCLRNRLRGSKRACQSGKSNPPVEAGRFSLGPALNGKFSCVEYSGS